MPWTTATGLRVLGWMTMLLVAGSAAPGFAAGVDGSRAGEGSVATGHYLFRAYGAEQGLANVGVLQLLQDRNDFLWVGTEDGLYRYDGARFTTYGLSEGLSSTTIGALFEDSNDVLWVGTQAGLSRRRGAAFVVIGEAQGLPETAINGIAEETGLLWLATPRGPYVGTLDAGRFKGTPDWPGGEATAVAVRDSAVWMARWQERAEVLLRRDEGWRAFAPPAGAPRERVDALAVDAEGTLWARTRSSLWRLPRGASAFAAVETPLPLHSSRGYLALDRRGDLFVASDQALLKRVGDAWQVLGPEQGLPGAPWPVLEDREGSLWIGAVGLHRLLGRGVFRAVTAAEGLPFGTVWCIQRDRAGRLWVGTSHGVAYLEGSRFRLLPGTEQYAIRSIVQGRDGMLYLAGVPGNEVLAYDAASGELARHDLPADASPQRIFRLAAATDGSLWVASDGVGLLRADAEERSLRFARVALPGGTPQEYLRDVREDAQARVWAAGEQGLAVLEQGEWRRFTRADGLRSDHVAYALPLADGLVFAYFDPLGAARARYTGGKFEILRHYDALDPGSPDKIFLLGEDARGGLWIGGGKGVDRLDADGRLRHFGTRDGLVGEDTGSMAFLAEADGDVWIGTTQGLIRYDAQADAALPAVQPPHTALLSLRIDQDERRHRREASVALHDATFEAQYAGLSFVNEGRVEYRVRLSGREEEYHVTDTRVARYSALDHGDYRFEVAARGSPEGAWGPTAHFEFTVLPAWWQTWWFRLVAGLATIAMLGGVLQLRTARLRRENARLESLVAARTRDLQAANLALEEASMIDPLTGLKNRRFLQAFLPEEIARSQRQRRAVAQDPESQLRNVDLCVLLVDLDHFKSVNDEHGHNAGDLVLRQVARAMQAACRRADVVARWGGEEFLVLARNIDRYCAPLVAEQLRETIRSQSFDLGEGTVLKRTCSIGFALLPLLSSEPNRFGWDEVIELADQCLYAAKSGGRDAWMGCLLGEAEPAKVQGAAFIAPLQTRFGAGIAVASREFPPPAAG